MQCPNCKAYLSCGCQQKYASNGRVCCTQCINSYEQSLKLVEQAKNVSKPQEPHTGHQP